MAPIVDPSFNYIEQPSLQYNKPVSEASLTALGSSINGLLSILLPVGSTIDSMLTEAQFQTQIGNPSPETWVLADGRSSAGSLYEAVTGNSNIPDLRGLFKRGKNNGRSDGKQNPDGDLALGTYTADQLASHTHSYTAGGGLAAIGSVNSGPTDFGAPNFGATTGATGGNQTAPATITMNIFIRIN